MLHGLSSSAMVDMFQSTVDNILCETFPEKHIVISPYDDPWFNENLRHLKRQMQRHYERHGKDEIYKVLNTKFEDKLKAEMFNYKNKIEEEVRTGKKGKYLPSSEAHGLKTV